MFCYETEEILDDVSITRETCCYPGCMYVHALYFVDDNTPIAKTTEQAVKHWQAHSCIDFEKKPRGFTGKHIVVYAGRG